MGKRTSFIIAVLFVLAFAVTGYAADKEFTFGDDAYITISGQYRPLYEYRELYDFDEETSMDFFSHRARVGIMAGHPEYFRVFLQLQDVRFWGEEASTLGDYNANNFDLHQGWGELYLGDVAKIKIGRQEMMYDNQRILGNVDWSQQGRVFDAAKLVATHNIVTITGWYSLLVDEDLYPNSDIIAKNVDHWEAYSGHIRLTPFEYFNASVIYIGDADSNLRRYRNTFGLYIDGKALGLTYSLEGYYQIGQWDAATNMIYRDPDAQENLLSIGRTEMAIDAHMFAVRVDYTSDVLLNPGVGLWFEWLSGDNDPTDDNYRTFDTLFATNHKFYGIMDLFTNIPVHTTGLGLLDAGAKIHILAFEAFGFDADYHYFALAKGDVNDDKELGHEVDLVANLKFNDYAAVQWGYGVFMPSEAMELIRGGDEDEQFTYVRFDFNF